jgi:predicted transcriptional regulator
MTINKGEEISNASKTASELSNEISRKIIFSIISKAKSGVEISNDTKISQSTVYQKISILKDLSLVQVDHKEITTKGRGVEFLKSNISKATIIINGEQPKIILNNN